jgi:hypothetical protein
MWDLVFDIGPHHLSPLTGLLGGQRDSCSSHFQSFVLVSGEGLKLEPWNKHLFSCLKSMESGIYAFYLSVRSEVPVTEGYCFWECNTSFCSPQNVGSTLICNTDM